MGIAHWDHGTDGVPLVGPRGCTSQAQDWHLVPRSIQLDLKAAGLAGFACNEQYVWWLSAIEVHGASRPGMR